MSPIPALTWRNLGIYHIYGANTDVGKTIFATALCRAASALYTGQHTSYLKPVSTGPEDEADARCKCAYLTSQLKSFSPANT
jgi:bifunctional dethiobiotin synthetase / adenosylmethionine---8-amino-7-oxononanoate aminotransferase